VLRSFVRLSSFRPVGTEDPVAYGSGPVLVHPWRSNRCRCSDHPATIVAFSCWSRLLTSFLFLTATSHLPSPSRRLTNLAHGHWNSVGLGWTIELPFPVWCVGLGCVEPQWLPRYVICKHMAQHALHCSSGEVPGLGKVPAPLLPSVYLQPFDFLPCLAPASVFLRSFDCLT
jgi:hypothetical protein